MFLVGFCALLLGILWLFQTVLLNDMYKLIRRHELKKVIATVEETVESLEIEENQTMLFLTIQMENDITVSRTSDFVTPTRPSLFETAARGNTEYITEVREFNLRNGQVVSLTFFALITPLDATVSTLRLQLYIITAIMIVSSVLLAIIIAKRVSKPIEEINKSAGQLAEGNYGVRFGGKGFREIAELSETLNTAAVELGRVEALRRELLANVSHDLRTPLSLIYSYSEMMNDFPDEITSEQTKIIMSEASRLSSLVNDVLDLSKLENDMEQLNITDFSLTESVSEIIVRTRELLKTEKFEIIFEFDKEVFINADRMKIDRAFYNLLINAVNYSGESRIVIVKQILNEVENFVRISVTDGGDGISEEDLPYIWDRYFKSGKAHKRAVTGTGLGLSIVKRIIELHGGKYGVETEQGKGSSFWFEIKY